MFTAQASVLELRRDVQLVATHEGIAASRVHGLAGGTLRHAGAALYAGGRVKGGLRFGEWVAVVKPDMIVFAPASIPKLSSADMVDQCALVKMIFHGKWPSLG